MCKAFSLWVNKACKFSLAHWSWILHPHQWVLSGSGLLSVIGSAPVCTILVGQQRREAICWCQGKVLMNRWIIWKEKQQCMTFFLAFNVSLMPWKKIRCWNVTRCRLTLNILSSSLRAGLLWPLPQLLSHYHIFGQCSSTVLHCTGVSVSGDGKSDEESH